MNKTAKEIALTGGDKELAQYLQTKEEEKEKSDSVLLNDRTVLLNDNEVELYESILRAKWGDYPYDFLDSDDRKRAYYLTCTPASEWHSGQLKNFPDSFYRRISDMPINFKKATDAVHLGSVFFEDRETGKSAFMVWITINEWISETEVVVEQGMWHEFLWGHGSTAIYIKVEGEWKLKKILDSWIS